MLKVRGAKDIIVCEACTFCSNHAHSYTSEAIVTREARGFLAAEQAVSQENERL